MVSFDISIAAGSSAGFVSTLLVYPLDFVRTKIQAGAVAQKPPTTMEIVRPLLSRPHLFYTGLSIPLAAQVVYKSTIFTTVSLLQSHVGNYPFLNGCIAGGVNALFVVTPTEYIRSNIMGHGSTLSSFRRISVLAMDRGAYWSVLRDVFGCGGFFSASSLLSENFPSLPPSARGAFAGVAFWTLALPLDSVKTLVQTGKDRGAVYDIFRKNPGRLFNSWGVAYARGIPGAASTIAVYEYVSDWLEGERRRSERNS